MSLAWGTVNPIAGRFRATRARANVARSAARVPQMRGSTSRRKIAAPNARCIREYEGALEAVAEIPEPAGPMEDEE
jgi:hypothetical protein